LRPWQGYSIGSVITGGRRPGPVEAVRLDGIDVEAVSLAPQRERTLSAQPVAARNWSTGGQDPLSASNPFTEDAALLSL
jgi:hypothetical protein